MDNHAVLQWHIDMGCDECVADEPINRFETSAQAAVASASVVADGQRTTGHNRPQSRPISQHLARCGREARRDSPDEWRRAATATSSEEGELKGGRPDAAADQR